MSDKTLLLAEAMNYIDEKFIEEAHSEARGVPYRVANRRHTLRQIAAVACLCIVAIGVARLPAWLDGDFTFSGVGNSAPEAMGPSDGALKDEGNGDHENKAPEGAPPAEGEQATTAESETETEAET